RYFHVTGVQTCALPILFCAGSSENSEPVPGVILLTVPCSGRPAYVSTSTTAACPVCKYVRSVSLKLASTHIWLVSISVNNGAPRSEERRVGTGGEWGRG